MYLITKWFGSFLYTTKGIQEQQLFPQDEKEIIKRLQHINENKILVEEKSLIKGKKEIRVGEKRLQDIGEYREHDPFFGKIRIDPQQFGFTQDLFHRITVVFGQYTLDHQLHAPDLQLIQMVNALDDLIQTANLFSERIQSWSVLPTSPEKLTPFTDTYKAVNREIHRLEQQIENDMQRVAPNIYTLIGPLVGARLIALAGGIDKLAHMPASTIQILGAEKALFRYKKEGGKPPKHGVIFQHALINTAARVQRGRLARMLAAKLAIAAKADAFTKRDISEELLSEMQKRVKEIRKK
jgi:nucleolar protein 56